MFESHSATPACAETRDADIAFAGGIFALLHAAARRVAR
jgi:hypothetical protein